jgi:hypothetical protein
MHDHHLSSTTQSQDVQLGESVIETPATISAPSTPGPERHSVDDGSSTGQGTESNDKPKPLAASVPLRRSVYPVLLTLLYGSAAVYAWVIICILNHRPIGGVSYGQAEVTAVLNNPPPNALSITVPEYLDWFFARSEKYLRAARIVQSLVSVATIPLTSAVCSQAAVVYIQRTRGANRPTLRQSMALADKGWTDITILKNLLFGSWNRYRSSLLLFALFLHLLGGFHHLAPSDLLANHLFHCTGAAISPVQQIFLSFQTIKRASYPVDLTHIRDFTDLFPYPGFAALDPDTGLLAARLRATLTSADDTMVQPRLWSASTGTVSLDEVISGDGSYSPFQTKSQNTLANLSTITEPFWAEIPSGTNTGTLQQFAPRINSTATWEDNPSGVLPEDCNSSSDAFYLRYEYADMFQYSVEICMPGNMSQSPWKNQMSRQDISEDLYLKMNFSGNYDAAISNLGAQAGTYSSKVALHTTTGYFELPNYANGQVPGPLIEGNPFSSSAGGLNARDLDSDTAWRTLNATDNLAYVLNKGPLLNIAMALFGEASFVDVNHTSLAAYANSGIIYGGCIDTLPFISLLGLTFPGPGGMFTPCLVGGQLFSGNDTDSREGNNLTMHALVAAYFSIFSGDPYSLPPALLENGFASAAFLTNDLFMTTSVHSPTISISYDMGTDQQIPHISRAGVIFVSVLLGLDLACLLALALYSAWIPRWTGTLDSFAMLRIGASISDRTPLLATRHAELIKTLDETPGWIGNASDGEVGELCLGGERPLRETKHYRGYDTNRVAHTTATRRREGYSLAPGDGA